MFKKTCGIFLETCKLSIAFASLVSQHVFVSLSLSAAGLNGTERSSRQLCRRRPNGGDCRGNHRCSSYLGQRGPQQSADQRIELHPTLHTGRGDKVTFVLWWFSSQCRSPIVPEWRSMAIYHRDGRRLLLFMDRFDLLTTIQNKIANNLKQHKQFCISFGNSIIIGVIVYWPIQSQNHTRIFSGFL